LKNDSEFTAEFTAEMLRKAKDNLMYFTNKPDIVFSRGEGSYLWDTEGNRYIDMIAGWAVCCLGHTPPVVADALNRQAALLVNPSPSFYNVPAIEFAEILCGISCMDKVFFINSGAEANESAVKLARKYGQKYKNGAYEIITAWNSFHGRTLAMMAATGKKYWDPLFPPRPEGFVRVNYNDIEDLRAAVSPNTCAIMLELIQGEGGVIVGDKDYIKQVREICDSNDIVFIIDEVQTGLGRLGRMFGYEAYDIEPDVMTLAKGIGGGFPLSAMLAKDKFCCFNIGDVGGTYCGTPLAAAVGKAVVEEIIRSNLVDTVKRNGDYFTERLLALRDKNIGICGVRGMGLLLAAELADESAERVKDICVDNYLLINAPNKKCLRFMPALNISADEIDGALAVLERALLEVYS